MRSLPSRLIYAALMTTLIVLLGLARRSLWGHHKQGVPQEALLFSALNPHAHIQRGLMELNFEAVKDGTRVENIEPQRFTGFPDPADPLDPDGTGFAAVALQLRPSCDLRVEGSSEPSIPYWIQTGHEGTGVFRCITTDSATKESPTMGVPMRAISLSRASSPMEAPLLKAAFGSGEKKWRMDLVNRSPIATQSPGKRAQQEANRISGGSLGPQISHRMALDVNKIQKHSRQAAESAPIFAKPFVWIAGAVVFTFSVFIAIVFGFTNSMKPLYQRERGRYRDLSQFPGP